MSCIIHLFGNINYNATFDNVLVDSCFERLERTPGGLAFDLPTICIKYYFLEYFHHFLKT